MKVKSLTLVMFCFALFFNHGTVFAKSLSGEVGVSPKWGSGWLDLAEVQNFHKGDVLKLSMGGTAKKVVVRVLQKGVDPNTPAGVVGGIVDVPEKRLIEITLDAEFTEVIQISVHGKSNPWGLYDLGEGNGPATLVSAEVARSGLKSEKETSKPPVFTRLKGEIGVSAKWGSGWLDLAEVQNFHKGDVLKLSVGGTAKKVVVRVLQKGVDPNTPAGVVGGIVDVPEKRLIEITLDAEFTEVIQISVHGKSNPWGLYNLGEGNGPATLLTCHYGKTVE